MSESDMVSNRMSEKMLLGWALLAETCPVDECYTPLMSTKKQAHKVYCVKCERWFSTELAAKNETTKVPEPKAPEPKVEAVKVEAPWQESEAEAAAYREKKKKRDAASAKMGEKMLQGWTLLGLHCPVPECLMPLMRSREGQMYCVNCEQYVMTEEEMAAHTQTTTETSAVSEASSAPPSPVVAPKHTPPPPPTSPLAKRRALSVPNEFDFAAMNRMAIDVLYEKMDTALGQLEAATKPKDAAEIAKLVRELAKAIKALQSLGDEA